MKNDAFEIGSIVKYRPEYCRPEERRYIHRIIERRINPITGTETRYLIETLNMENMTLRPTEVVDDYMIETA